MNATPTHEQSLFHAALKRTDPAARAAFLDCECRGDAALRRRLDALLRAHAQVANALDGSTGSTRARARGVLASAAAELSGDRIGPYKLLEQIGEGGYGTVWMAEQDKPVHRRVALKIIKLGMDTKEVIGRFEQERQALALMEHPNIARVIDAGATPLGRPYFVMELVRGLKITTYCDEHHLPVTDRINLFIQVCHAVQHAHQKGIIHRDLKPANVLVTVNDGQPVAKVIDFGVAKATQGRLTEATFFTHFDRMIGTPRYMSPEQAEMTSVDVDTRSDIYSLGVILYELLTGLTPLDSATLAAAGLEEVRRLVREVDAVRPSVRIQSLSGTDLTTAAQRRQTESLHLPALLRGDLDWIVMKCLDKDRQRRYDSPNALALDLQQHLTHGVVTARPPTLGYLAGRFIRRHKLAVAAGTAVVLSLVAGLAVASFLFVREKAARQRAVTAEREQARSRQIAEAASAEAVASEKKARTAAAKSEHVANFLTEMLKGVGPSVALGRDTTLLREILEKTANRIDTEFKNQPELQAELHSVLADVYNDIGFYARSEAHLRASIALREPLFGPDDAEVAALYSALGTALELQGQLAQSELAFRRALATRQKTHGPRHAAVTHALTKLAHVLTDQRKLPEAKALFAEAYAARATLMDAPTAERAESIHNLGDLASKQRQYPEAEALLRQSLAIRRQLSRVDTPDIAAALGELSYIFHMQLRYPEAEQFGRECLALRRKLLGPEHPDVALVLNNLGVVLHDQGKYPEAESMLREAITIREARLGSTHAWTLGTVQLLAGTLESQGKHTAAEALLRRSLNPPDLAPLAENSRIQLQLRLAAHLLAQKSFTNAEPLLLTSYASLAAAAEKSPAALTEEIRSTLQQLVALYQATTNAAQSAAWQKKLADFNARHPVPPRP
ncbi:hypothetical protein LBMAG56_50040 [Verrucomicrobiota bacterium]|nr:hypothetical protein LBMAG56_50040 [Verrucomicrobiota bacterium]